MILLLLKKLSLLTSLLATLHPLGGINSVNIINTSLIKGTEWRTETELSYLDPLTQTTWKKTIGNKGDTPWKQVVPADYATSTPSLPILSVSSVNLPIVTSTSTVYKEGNREKYLTTVSYIENEKKFTKTLSTDITTPWVQ